MFLADELLLGLAKKIRKFPPLTSYYIEGICKKNAMLESLFENNGRLFESFGSHDFIVVNGGFHNARKGARIPDETIRLMRDMAKRTNIIITFVPYWHKRKVLNKYTFNVNRQLFTSLKMSKNIAFMDVNDFLGESNFFNRCYYIRADGKRLYMRYLLKVIRHMKIKNKRRKLARKFKIYNTRV